MSDMREWHAHEAAQQAAIEAMRKALITPALDAYKETYTAVFELVWNAIAEKEESLAGHTLG